eukprot:71308-Amphidinium_carterae.1
MLRPLRLWDAAKQPRSSSQTASATMHAGAAPKRVAKPKTGLSKDLRGDGRHVRSGGGKT